MAARTKRGARAEAETLSLFDVVDGATGATVPVKEPPETSSSIRGAKQNDRAAQATSRTRKTGAHPSAAPDAGRDSHQDGGTARAAGPEEQGRPVRPIQTVSMQFPENFDYLADPEGWLEMASKLFGLNEPIRTPNLRPGYERRLASGTATTKGHAAVPITTDIIGLPRADVDQEGNVIPPAEKSNYLGYIEKALWFLLVHHAYPTMNRQFAFRIRMQDIQESLSNRMVLEDDGRVVPAMANRFKSGTVGEMRVEENDRIWKSVRLLMSTQFTWDYMQDEKTRIRHSTPLLGESHMVTDEGTGEGYLIYTMPLGIMLLIANPNAFAEVRLRVVNSFTSVYATNLYLLLQRRMDMLDPNNPSSMKPVSYKVDDLRCKLEVPEGALTSFGNLRQKALKPAIDQINAFTEFNIEMTEVKGKGRGSPVAEVKFYVRKKEGISEYERLYLSGTTKEERRQIVSNRKQSLSGSIRTKGASARMEAPAAGKASSPRRASKFTPSN